MASGQWISGLILAAVLGLPWLSLLLSLPAICSFRLELQGPDWVEQGEDAEIWLVGSSGWPLPPFSGKLHLTHRITGQYSRYRPELGLPTGRCGGIAVAVRGARVYDYLGLFSFSVRHLPQKTVLVRPRPLPVASLPDLKRCLARSWRPKSGGGFAENHELRLYRPGDSLNQVHWKLTAKTGKLTVREPMLPQRGLVLLTLALRGTDQELDRKLGRLLWLGNHLLELEIPFEIRAVTANGAETFPVGREQELVKAVDSLLCTGAVTGEVPAQRFDAASWQYEIGGGPDEA